MLDTTGRFTNTDKKNIAAAAVVMFSAMFGILFAASLVRAWVLTTLWGWYIVSFFNTKPMPLAVAYGISLIYLYLESAPTVKDQRSTNEKLLMAFLRPVMVLFYGWIGTFFL